MGREVLIPAGMHCVTDFAFILPFLYLPGDEGEAEKDEMQKLEEKARQLAEESAKDQAKPDKGILFVR